MPDDFSYQEIVEMLRDHSEAIAFDMMTGCKRSGPRLYGDCQGKASVVIKGKDTGLVGFWQGQRDARGGNLVHLIEIGMSMPSHGHAVRYAKEKYLGIQDRPFTEEEKREWAKRRRQAEQQQAARVEADAVEFRNKTSLVKSLWKEAVEVDGTPAEKYLRNRIGFYHYPPSLRFHPGIHFDPVKKSGQAFPCLIAAVQAPNRELIAVWRIYLQSNGSNLLRDGQKVKLGFGPSSGGVVRLTPVSEEQNVGEGLESTIGAQALCRFQGSWASALSTSGLRGMRFADGVKRLVIWSDGDRAKFRKGTEDTIAEPPGQAAAEHLKQRAIEAGMEVKIMTPPPGSDWADVWEARRNG